MRVLLALTTMLSLPPSGALRAACPVGEVGPLEVIGPLLDADPRQMPSVDAPGPGRFGAEAWRPAEGPCGQVALGAEGGRYLVRGLIGLPPTPVAALHVRVEGIARVFWGGALIGAVADGPQVFGVPGGGAQPLLIEVRHSVGPRLTLWWSTPDRAPLAAFRAEATAPAGEGPRSPVALPIAMSLPFGPPVLPQRRTPDLPPADVLPPFERGQPAPPGVDLELLHDARQVDLEAGRVRRQVRLRPLTPAGLRALARLTLPEWAHLGVEGVVHGLEGPLPLTEAGAGGLLALPPVAVGDAVDLTWFTGVDGTETRSAALPTARWSLTVNVRRGRPLETAVVGAVGPEVDDGVPGRRRLRWVGRAVPPGGATVRIGASRDAWPDAFLAAEGDALWARHGERRADARAVAARTPTFATPWQRAAWATRALRAAGLPATPLFVRATPLPPGPIRAEDFDDVVAWLPGEPLPPGAVVWPAAWGAAAQVVAGDPAPGPLTCAVAPPASLLDPPGPAIPAIQVTERAGPAAEISTDFAVFQRDGAGRARLALRRAADPRALARLCARVAP